MYFTARKEWGELKKKKHMEYLRAASCLKCLGAGLWTNEVRRRVITNWAFLLFITKFPNSLERTSGLQGTVGKRRNLNRSGWIQDSTLATGEPQQVLQVQVTLDAPSSQ